MPGFNLPPGCSANSIPGNSNADMAWERFHETIDEDAEKHGLDLRLAYTIWHRGLELVMSSRANVMPAAVYQLLAQMKDPSTPQHQITKTALLLLRYGMKNDAFQAALRTYLAAPEEDSFTALLSETEQLVVTAITE